MLDGATDDVANGGRWCYKLLLIVLLTGVEDATSVGRRYSHHSWDAASLLIWTLCCFVISFAALFGRDILALGAYASFILNAV
jgi:hypothetical protein